MSLYYGGSSRQGGLAYVPANEVISLEIVEPGDRAPHGCVLVDAPATVEHMGLHVEIPLAKYQHALASVLVDEAAGRRTVIYA